MCSQGFRKTIVYLASSRSLERKEKVSKITEVGARQAMKVEERTKALEEINNSVQVTA